MLIDTHSHFGIVPVAESLQGALERSRKAGVVCGLITTGTHEDFEKARLEARRIGWGYCVGIHPIFVHRVSEDALLSLESSLTDHIDDPYLIGIGEIGLDFYIEDPDRKRQEYFFKRQMALAERFALPVSIHARRSLYRVIEVMDEYRSVGGSVHAFPGSPEQAREVLKRGYGIGIGGALTYPGSKRLRRCAAAVEADALLLETDAPDMPPSFNAKGQSEPAYLAAYLEELSRIRGEDAAGLQEQIFKNTLRFFPRLKGCLPPGLDCVQADWCK